MSAGQSSGSMFTILVVVSTITTVFADATSTQPAPGVPIPRSRGPAAMRTLDLTGNTAHLDSLRGHQNEGVDHPASMVLGGVDIVAHQVSLPHPRVTRSSTTDPETPYRDDRLQSQRSNFTHADAERPLQPPTPPSAVELAHKSSSRTSPEPPKNSGASSPVDHRTSPPREGTTGHQHKVQMRTAMTTTHSEEKVSATPPGHKESDFMKAGPPLYGILSAMLASMGYAVLTILRCKGFVNELAPKPPMAGFMHSHLERPSGANAQNRRSKRKAIARFCPGRRPDAKIPQGIPNLDDMGEALTGAVPDPP